ncbi:MAG: hypothetical protein AAB370_09110 [Verrucomicrobiota bacterium]
MSSLNKQLTEDPAVKKAFGRLRRRCKSNVARWEYWLWPDWHWIPDYLLEHHKSPKRTSRKKACYHYGYDAVGRVVFIREDFEPEDEDDGTFYFLRYSGNTVSGFELLGGELYPVFEAALSNGRIVKLEQTRFDDWNTKIIEWREGSVFKVITTKKHDRSSKVVIEQTYNQKGKLIAEVDRSKIKEKPLPKGVTLKSLGDELQKRLIQAVVKTVTKHKLKKPVYCLALNYDCEGNPIMPPMLAIGLDSERQARLKKGGKDAKLDIWEPEQMSLFAKEETDEVIFADKKLQQACDYYNRLLEKKGDNTPAHKLLNEIAAELGHMDWKGKLNTTDDFIAYAVDTDLADLQKNLKQSVPAVLLKKLKAAKML